MSRIAEIEFKLLVAARQCNMQSIESLVSNLSPEQKSSLDSMVINEAMASAAKYTAKDPILGASTIVTMMRVLGYRISPETMDMAIQAFPTPRGGASARSYA
jgi:hypothetical protein